jgi:hypothetical protein
MWISHIIDSLNTDSEGDVFCTPNYLNFSGTVTSRRLDAVRPVNAKYTYLFKAPHQSRVIPYHCDEPKQQFCLLQHLVRWLCMWLKIVGYMLSVNDYVPSSPETPADKIKGGGSNRAGCLGALSITQVRGAQIVLSWYTFLSY